MPGKLKVAVIREEYVAICGNYQLAIVLNQIIYWSERVKDFDFFITEENARLKNKDSPENFLSHGWFYKSAKELSEELMTGWSERTIGRYMKELEKFGFISSRRNPNHKWDKTLQYRINLNAIKKSLESQGYNVHNYREATPNGIGKMSDRDGKMSDRDGKIVKAIPKTTPEKTTEITNSGTIPQQQPSPEQYKTEHDTLVGLIPESMRQPAIINLVDKYHRSQGFEHVADCIVYTNQRPQREGNGTWQAYRGYLSKGLAGHYEGISGMYASVNSNENKKKSGRQEILESITFNRKKFFIMNDGRRYKIEEGFVPHFEFVSKDTGKIQKCTLIPSQVADIVMSGKAALE